MRPIIKAPAAQQFVRPLGEARPPLPAALHERRSEREAALEEEIDALGAALAQQRDAAAEAEAQAREEGRREGRAAADEAAAERRATLEEALAALRAGLDVRLDGIEQLAALLARAALARLFDEWCDGAEFVQRSLARQLALLRRETVLAVHVSAADFGDEAALAALAARANATGIALRADTALPSGGCRIDLRLGHVDLARCRQWRQLAALLDDFTGAEAA